MLFFREDSYFVLVLVVVLELLRNSGYILAHPVLLRNWVTPSEKFQFELVTIQRFHVAKKDWNRQSWLLMFACQP